MYRRTIIYRRGLVCIVCNEKLVQFIKNSDRILPIPVGLRLRTTGLRAPFKSLMRHIHTCWLTFCLTACQRNTTSTARSIRSRVLVIPTLNWATFDAD